MGVWCNQVTYYIWDVEFKVQIFDPQPFRKESNLERDRLSTSKGIVIYRIKWKSINNDLGKSYIKEEISNFLNYYNTL